MANDGTSSTRASKPVVKTATTKTDEKKSPVRKQYAAVPLAALKPQALAPAEKSTVLPGRERSDEQKYIDQVVRDNVKEFMELGQPAHFRDMPVQKYTLPSEQIESVKYMLDKAGAYLNVKMKYGKQAWDNGMEVLSFASIPRDPSQWATELKTEESVVAVDDKPKTDSAPNALGKTA